MPEPLKSFACLTTEGQEYAVEVQDDDDGGVAEKATATDWPPASLSPDVLERTSIMPAATEADQDVPLGPVADGLVTVHPAGIVTFAEPSGCAFGTPVALAFVILKVKALDTPGAAVTGVIVAVYGFDGPAKTGAASRAAPTKTRTAIVARRTEKMSPSRITCPQTPLTCPYPRR